MKSLIQQKLNEIEKSENCRILLAVESGSRAWGFSSPDSDYDVRFIYARPKEKYLELNQSRDVIELPINETLDINGWDIDKTLRLVHKSNPTVFEWLSSPIVYKTTSFISAWRDIMQDYFSAKSSLWHYIRTAERNYHDHIKADMVVAKKYFYCLRPILACNWIIDRNTIPPMLFSELAEAYLPEYLTESVNDILRIKRSSTEAQVIPKVDLINDYVLNSVKSVKGYIETLPKEEYRDWRELNRVFLSAIGEV